MATNQGCKGLVPDASLDGKFLYYYLFSITDLLESLGAGTTFKELSGTRLKSVPLPLPPLDEQKRIVAVLDETFEGLARSRENVEANLLNAKDVFESWLSVRFSEIAADAPEKTLPEISENLDRQRVPITQKDRLPGNVPYYGASGVVDHVAESLFDEDLLLVSEDGANLLARSYPIAFSISGPSWVNNHAHVLRFANHNTQEFVRLYLNSISLEPFVSGMAQPKLNQQSLNRIGIPYPDEAIRTRIVEGAGFLDAQVRSIVEQYEARRSDLANLRQSLLQKAFAGELT